MKITTVRYQEPGTHLRVALGNFENERVGACPGPGPQAPPVAY